MIDPGEEQALRRLWMAVMHQAIRDALAPEVKHRGNRKSAAQWFGGWDFRTIFNILSVCPNRFMTNMQPRLDLADQGRFVEACNGLGMDEWAKRVQDDFDSVTVIRSGDVPGGSEDASPVDVN